MFKKFLYLKQVIITFVCLIIFVIIGGALWFASRPEDESMPVSVAIDAPKEVSTPTEEKNFRYTEPMLREMVEAAAKQQFGEDAFIIFLSSEGATNIEIHGINRNIYIYAVDSKAAYDQTGEIRGLYHIDADTGEIFDNGSGNMEKIKIEE